MSTHFEVGAEYISVSEFAGPDGEPCAGFDCPSCGVWGIVTSARFGRIRTDGGLTVEKPIRCGDRISTNGCGAIYHVAGGVGTRIDDQGEAA